MAVSTIPGIKRIIKTDGEGVSGSNYLYTIDWRVLEVQGNTVTVTVACTTVQIPAWTEFMTVGQAYRNSNLRQLRMFALKGTGTDPVAIEFVPSSGAIRTMNEAIASGTTLSFWFSYTLP